MRMLLLVAGMAVLSGKVLAADAVEMNASDIIKKSDAAYAAVKTYVGTTTMCLNNTVTGNPKLDQASTAKVTFVRPGKVHIEGKIGGLAQGRPFAIVSDGKKTWKSFALQSTAAFSEVPNLQLAGASVMSLGVAEGIPAALMKSDGAPTGGHDPFQVARTSAATLAGHETIDGADCYKLVAKNPQLGDVTLWIDSKSFLLRQMTREHSDAQMVAARKSAEEAMQKIGKVLPAHSAPKSITNFFAFTIDQVDGAVDAKLFNDPTKK